MSGDGETLEMGDRNRYAADAAEANEASGSGTAESGFGDRNLLNESIAIMTGLPDEDDEDEDEDEYDEQTMDKLFKRLSVFRRSEMNRTINERKEILSKLGVNIDQTQGEGFSDSRNILDHTRVKYHKKTGKPIGIRFDGVQITAFKNGEIEYSKDQKVQVSVNAFKELAKKAYDEQKKTLGAMVRNISIKENLDNENKIEVTPEIIELVNMRAIGETDERIEELEDKFKVRDPSHPGGPDVVILTENEIREMNGAMKPKGHPDVQVAALKELARGWRDKVKKTGDDKLKASVYETQAKICELKADNIQLKRGLRVTSQEGTEIVKKIFKNNEYTSLERFKVWARKNMVGLAGIGITVASIITSIILYARNSLTGVADGVKKVASALKNVADKIGSSASGMARIMTPIASLLGVILGFLAHGVAFLAQNLWILAVALTYWLYRQLTSRR